MFKHASEAKSPRYCLTTAAGLRPELREEVSVIDLIIKNRAVVAIPSFCRTVPAAQKRGIGRSSVFAAELFVVPAGLLHRGDPEEDAFGGAVEAAR